MKRLPVVPRRNQELRRDYDHAGLRRLVCWALGGMVLAAGFLFAAWQHYVAVRYGYDYQKVHLERRDLEATQLRLRADWERAMALPNLENKALESGLQPLQPSQIEILTANIKAAQATSQAPPTRSKKARNR
jgi:hypothetical protein